MCELDIYEQFKIQTVIKLIFYKNATFYFGKCTCNFTSVLLSWILQSVNHEKREKFINCINIKVWNMLKHVLQSSCDRGRCPYSRQLSTSLINIRRGAENVLTAPLRRRRNQGRRRNSLSWPVSSEPEVLAINTKT